MNGSALYTLLGELLSGFELNETLFYSYLNIARVIREGERSWRVLRKLDSSLSVSSATTYATLNALPSDFRKPVAPRTVIAGNGTATVQPVQLVDANGIVVSNLSEITFGELQAYKDVSGHFAIDYANRKIRFTGSFEGPYTVHLHYIQDPGDITANTQWVFPENTHSRMLVHDVAAMYELGADYDDQNARMGNANAQLAERIAQQMRRWDNELTLGSIGN